MSTAYDSCLFKNIFGTQEIREVFSDDSYIRNMITTEISLAKAEGQCDIIPNSIGDAIYEFGKDLDHFSIDKSLLGEQTDIVGYCVLPLLNQLTSQFPENLGGYLHWGATTQDIMDTASMLQIKKALEIVEKYLLDLMQILKDLAQKYKETPMAGRTHWQHALPVTFGYKCAIWLSSLQRSFSRLQELKPRCLLVQFGGAAGTLASLGNDSNKGLNVRAKLANLLGLNNPSITWHVARDGIAEIINLLAIICGSLGKVALDIIAMSSNELDEVSEPYVSHRGASSTMPQKRNPISSEYILAASKVVRANAGLVLDGLVADFERASGPWHLEWVAIPESFISTVGSLHQMKFVLGGLEVKTDSMLRNLESTKGLIVAEAVMMGLAPFIGRHDAHEIVYKCCVKAHDGKTALYDILRYEQKIIDKVDLQVLKKLCDPINYLGCSSYMIDDVLNLK